MNVVGNKLASAIFGGFADGSYVREFQKLLNGAIVSVANFLSRVDKFLSTSFIGGAWSFFKNWFASDRVGATAGVLLGVVILVVGGVVIAGAIGGIATLIAGLGAMGLLGKIGAIIGVGFTAATIGTAIRWVVRATGYLYNFNWNQSDADIAKQQQALIDSLWGQFGETLGTALGTGLCGVAPVEILKRTKVIKTNPALLAKLKLISEGSIWGEDRPELYDELMEQVKSLIQFGAQQLRNWAFLETYKNLRKWIKRGANNVGLKRMFPRLGDWIERWGNDEPWSFAIEVENQLEKISDTRVRTFAEETVEAFMDSCSESLMIVSYAF